MVIENERGNNKTESGNRVQGHTVKKSYSTLKKVKWLVLCITVLVVKVTMINKTLFPALCSFQYLPRMGKNTTQIVPVKESKSYTIKTLRIEQIK